MKDVSILRKAQILNAFKEHFGEFSIYPLNTPFSELKEKYANADWTILIYFDRINPSTIINKLLGFKDTSFALNPNDLATLHKFRVSLDLEEPALFNEKTKPLFIKFKEFTLVITKMKDAEIKK